MNFQQTIVVGLALVCTLSTKIQAQSTSDSDSSKYEQQVFDSLDFDNWKIWKKFREKNPHLNNIGDTLYSNVSVSFLPFISTNGKLSFNTINRYSFNIWGGYSKGVEVMEIGGYFNIDNGDVKYLQIAGFTNIVSGNVTGYQFAGFANVNGKSTNGLQGAGFSNVVLGTFSGVQLSGFSNVVKDTMNGIQLAGFQNVTTKQTTGIQLAGFGNYTRQMDGIQGAGFFNYVNEKMKGVQFSGFMNSADTLDGLQISGFINRAKHVKGSQIGYLNFSRSCTGLPIGFFSYVHTGYHKIEIATDEQLITTLAFRTGVDKFHNIFLAGSDFKRSNGMMTLGYGIGTALKYNEKWYGAIDLTSQTLQISPTESDWNRNALNKLFLGVEFRPYNKISIAAGPTVNVWVANMSDANFTNLSQNLPNGFYHSKNDDVEIKAWIGGKISVKFL